MTYRIVYLGGAARSGTTLLGDMLGAQPRAFNVGELSLFWRDAARGGTCACGEPIPRCPVWGSALDTVQKTLGVGPDDWEGLAASRAQLARTRSIHRALSLVRSPRKDWPEDMQLLIEATDLLLATVCRITDSSVIVDSSKTATGVVVDRLGGRRLSLIHLVRDPRAVVTSSRRSRGVARGNAQSLPPGAGSLAGTARWLSANSSMLFASTWLPDRVKVSYEDLASDPSAILRVIGESLELKIDPSSVQGGSLRLSGPSHAAVGNPIRSDGAVRPITADHRWRTELPASHARGIHAVTAPLRLALGSPHRRTDSPTG